MPTAIELAKQFQAELVGDGSALLRGLAPLEFAQADQIAFLSNPLYRQQALDSAAGALIVNEADLEFIQAASTKPRSFIVAKNPYATFARIAQLFAGNLNTLYTPGIHAQAAVDASATVPPSCHIGPFVQIAAGVVLGERVTIVGNTSIGMDVRIGSDSVLYPMSTIYHGCEIGARCIIHSSTVIGADGFGFAPDFSATGGEWVKIPQTGRVVLEDDVEIGSSTTIDRGAMNETRIGVGCKIDNQVQIGHNVQIGAHTVVAGCVGISGSTTIGSHCMIGGFANFAGHLKIADRTTVSGGTSIIRSIIEPGQHFTGVYPSMLHAAWEKNAAILRGLDKIRQRLRFLERGKSPTNS
jgi:UDP-3-O-[3-hydroxymyristoyl] glucosamine N-acyltransferase